MSTTHEVTGKFGDLPMVRAQAVILRCDLKPVC